MRKQFKILIIFAVIVGLGIGGYFGYKVLIQRETFDFTNSDYMNAINEWNKSLANPYSPQITDPIQIFRKEKISRKEMKELASEAHHDRGIEDSVEGFLRFYGYTKGSGEIVYISYGKAKLSPFCVFVNKDGELSIHMTRLTVYK